MKVLLIAGTHGVEPQSSLFLQSLLSLIESKYAKTFSAKELCSLSLSLLLGFDLDPCEKAALSVQNLDFDLTCLHEAKLIAVPLLNPYGKKHFVRHNARGVDLNRNLPTKNWEAARLKIDGVANPYYPGEFPASELETQLLTRLIELSRCDLVISFHTKHFIRHPNPPQVNYDSVSGKYKAFAMKLAADTQLEFTEDIGYPTPGSLGSYAKDKMIDCITIEFDDNDSPEQLAEKYLVSFAENISALFSPSHA